MYSVALKIGFGDKAMSDIDSIVEGLKVKLDDFREFWPVVAGIAGRSFASNFARQAAISGTWPPLTPAYLKRKLRKGYPAQILVRTRALIRAATEISTSPRAHQIIIAEAKRFGFGLIGEVARYGNLHDTGRAKGGKLREFLVLTEDGKRKIFQEFTGYVSRETKKIWGEAT